ncbi:hypothetical protein M0R45_019379 [Rubus argutus]
METIDSAPFAEVVEFKKSKRQYKIKVDYWRNRFSDRAKEPYKTLPGDFFVLANAKPETVSDLEMAGSRVFKRVEVDESTSLFVVFLLNLIPSGRIWKALHMSRNLDIIEKVLCSDSVTRENLCSERNNDIMDKGLDESLSSGLNESQTGAVLACLGMLNRGAKSAVELIWGPPGTGKTKTIATLLFTLLRMNCRTLICAPTNVAITEVASRILKMVTEAEPNASLGKILLFGNKERLKLKKRLKPKVGSDIEEIYLGHRIQRLVQCLGPQTGWMHCFSAMISLLEDCVGDYNIFLGNVISEAMKNHFSCSEVEDVSELYVDDSIPLFVKRRECLIALRKLQYSLSKLQLPDFRNENALMELCFQGASLIFCTASSSFKLHRMEMEPFSIVVIDEAAQLKECESTIPLQLPGVKHAVLVGDECQLSATVKSNVSQEAGFARSLFQRLSSMGHSKHLLNMQYRMHPSISFFPNSSFYDNLILDAPNVRKKSYEKHYLPGAMFGPYSFANVNDGREEKDEDGHSRKNMVEVAIVLKLLRNLYKEWKTSQQKLSVGVVSPYAAQVVAIQDKLGRTYDNFDGFKVKVKTVDGFQGGEEDIIIMSTVRVSLPNSHQSLDFISNPQRVNVALTRARHCLWILGNERTLCNSESIWKALVLDAKSRQCFFNADQDKDLAKAIVDVKKELDQLDDLLNADSVLFKNARWKVLFSDNFLRSFKKLKSARLKKSALNLLLKLSSGWRPKKHNVVTSCSRSSQILKKFKVEGLYIVCTPDIAKDLRYIQILKVWDILPLEDIPKLGHRLETILNRYTDDFINLCEEKYLEGDLEVPQSWPLSMEFSRFKDFSVTETQSDFVVTLLTAEVMLRIHRELDLPFEVTDQERDIILHHRSSFIVGRSGTGKTTVLTMKLFQKERCYHLAMQGCYDTENSKVEQSSATTDGKVLRQLFVTVSPKLCFAIKQHVLHLKSFACGGSDSTERSLIDMVDFDEEESQFKDIQDSFRDIPPSSYPLVITFHKFLMMLDGTLSNSYFARFCDAPLTHGQLRSSRSVAFQAFIRAKEAYEKLKKGNGEFDLADFVIDLQRRLKHEKYEGDQMDFIYIDEVQDLTMSQIALFKHMCNNVDEGFVFSGDTAQTIARESSLIYGEAPVVLESGENENAIIKIFGNSGNIVGFGAEQVILVRDDAARKGISNVVGKHALVLTIVECKGLEFQDVLLYNFFGSSPLKNQLRLCSELKQLYVAVTRTRQRLWICETVEEISNPCLTIGREIEMSCASRQLDDSLAQAMQVASSAEEWKSRGIKLYRENNYEMATMCFERAGDTYWEQRSKAAGLKAIADRMRVSNPEVANSILREAAEIFDAIGKADSAARCFSDLGEYERAARIYLEKCGDSELERAAECFTLAECYEDAARVYARGNFFSECLSVCAKGKLFETGSLDELLSLEEEFGNYLEAAEIAQFKGDILLESDFLGKAGKFKDASMHVLFYVLASSLWSSGSKGWPMKKFAQQEVLLTKAKSVAKNDTEDFYELRCEQKLFPKSWEVVSVDAHQLVSAAQNYWSSELLSVGIEVLEKVDSLFKLAIRSSESTFFQSKALTLIYDVAIYLLNSKCLKRRNQDAKTLQKFVTSSTENFVATCFL